MLLAIDSVTQDENCAVEAAATDADVVDKSRIQIKNIPRFVGHKAFRQLLEKYGSRSDLRA